MNKKKHKDSTGVIFGLGCLFLLFTLPSVPFIWGILNLFAWVVGMPSVSWTSSWMITIVIDSLATWFFYKRFINKVTK